MSKLNAFDKIAPAYDTLARLMFGKSIRNAQRHYLSLVNSDAKVLVLGGGSGWILSDLNSVSPRCEVWYIEASFKMLSMAREHKGCCKAVHFMHGTEANIPGDISFNAIIANFYLDLYSPAELPGLIRSLKECLSDDGVVLVSDFVNTRKWWQQWLLRSMYAFFSLSCGIDNQKLPDWRESMQASGLAEYHSAQFFHGFIVSAAFYMASKGPGQG
jgi:ubiquinone/menaquinone biosynthesis C-methylase UbiE